MADSVVGYTNDLAPEKIVYTGRETDTTITVVDNDPDSPTYAEIGVFVKDSALGKDVVAGNNSIIVEEVSDRVKSLKVNVSPEEGNRLYLKNSGLYVDHSDYDDTELREGIRKNKEDISELRIEKQDKLVAGDNIKITNNTISATVPTKVSDLENDLEFVTEAKLALKKFATEKYVDDKIAAIKSISFEIVPDITYVVKPNVIYLIPVKDGKGTNIYEEWVLINGKPEKIGSTDIDLSQYATKQWVDLNFLKEHQDISHLATKIELSNTKREIETRIDTVDNKFADYAKKEDLNNKQDILVSGQNIKTINGTTLLGSGNIQTGTVKSVNGIGPDENGNVEIETEDKKNAYDNISKVRDYLYDTHYSELDYDYANEWAKKARFTFNRKPGACSSARNGNWYVRNYDWTYDNLVDFIIRTPRMNGRYATIGIGGNIPTFTKDVVESGDYKEEYKAIPFNLLDGINEYGVFANTNVVPTQKGKTTGTTPEGVKTDTICNIMLPRFILDYFKTAKEAVDYIRDHVSLYCYEPLYKMNEDVHCMVGDANETYIIEFINNRTVIKKHDKPIMTNFFVNDIILNDDGSVYTPEDHWNDSTKSAIKVNKITSHGCGLERFNLINSLYDTLINKENTQELGEKLFYTNTYKDFTNPTWYSEAAGDYTDIAPTIGDLTLDVAEEKYNRVFEVMKSDFESRSRDTGKTWQTIHSCTYDLANKTIYLIAQENIDDEIVLNFEYYTANQTDELLEKKQDKLIAGENISIVGNLISATCGKDTIGYEFTTDITVGHLEAGTPIHADDKIADILYRILLGQTPTGDTMIYLGYSEEIPSTFEEIIATPEEISVRELLDVEGILRNIKCPEGQRKLGTYACVVCDNKYTLKHWRPEGLAYDYDWQVLRLNNLQVNYLSVRSDDEDLGGNNYTLIFEEA